MAVVFGFLHTADIIFRCTLAFSSIPRNFPLRVCGSRYPSFPKISESWFCIRYVLGVLGAGASCLGVASILVGLSPSPSDRLIKIQLASLQLCPYLQSPSAIAFDKNKWSDMRSGLRMIEMSILLACALWMPMAILNVWPFRCTSVAVLDSSIHSKGWQLF